MTGHEWRNQKARLATWRPSRPPLECGPPRRHSTWYKNLASSWVHLIPSPDHPQAHPYPPFLKNLDWSRSISLGVEIRTIHLEWHVHDIKKEDTFKTLFS